MSQTTAIGEVEVSATMAVTRKDGTVEYYKVVNEQNVPITKDQYEALNQPESREE